MNVGRLIQEGKTGTVVQVVTQRVPQFRDGDDNQYRAPVLYIDFFFTSSPSLRGEKIASAKWSLRCGPRYQKEYLQLQACGYT